MIRLAVIGAGLIGREHCQLIRDHDGVELAAIADPSPEADALAREYGCPLFRDYAAMLDSAAPDGAIVALPTTLHAEAGHACLDRGIPSLIEKPVADTLSAALNLTEASEAANVPILIGHHRRHSPDMREARRIVAEGALGDIVAVNGLWMADKPDAYFDTDWRRQPGGGPILINLIHDIDCLRFIVGEIAEVRAFASSTARGFEVEDTVSIALRFENGVLGSFLLSDAAASPFTWETTSGQALYFPHRAGDCYVIAGRTGTLAIPSMRLWRRDAPDHHWQHPLVEKQTPLDGSRTYPNQLEHFLDIIRGRANPVVSARDGTHSLATALAVQIAAREDRTVAVQDLLTAAA